MNFLREAVKVLAFCDSIERDVYAMRLSDELGVGKDAILQQIGEVRKKESYRKTKAELSTAQKKVQNLDVAADPQRLKNVRAAKAEDTILVTLLNNASFYRNFKDRLSEDVFVTPVYKHLLEIIFIRLEESDRIVISHLSQYLTSEEVSVVARLLANQAMVSNTMKECEDCLLVLEEEKRKRETPTPANMSDDSFLEFFNSLKKDENN